MSKWALSTLGFPEGLERTLCRFPWLARTVGRGEALVCRQTVSRLLHQGHACELARCACGEGGVFSPTTLQALAWLRL